MTADRLFIIRHVMERPVEDQKRLRWQIVTLMNGDDPTRKEQIKIIDRVTEESNDAEHALRAVCLLFENQFQNETPSDL